MQVAESKIHKGNTIRHKMSTIRHIDNQAMLTGAEGRRLPRTVKFARGKVYDGVADDRQAGAYSRHGSGAISFGMTDGRRSASTRRTYRVNE